MTDDRYGQTKSVDVLNARGLAAKREYVRELEHRNDDQALQLLVECMCDESWYLRDLAEQVLVKLGERGAKVLVPLLGQGLWFSRTSAARVLGTLGYRPAVPDLLRLTGDPNQTVTNAARDALVAIGARRGAVRLACALHRMPPDARRRQLDEIGARDRALHERLERLMHNEELMDIEDVDSLTDDSPAVRAAEEGVEWEVLTGPPPPKEQSGEAGGGEA